MEMSFQATLLYDIRYTSYAVRYITPCGASDMASEEWIANETMHEFFPKQAFLSTTWLVALAQWKAPAACATIGAPRTDVQNCRVIITVGTAVKAIAKQWQPLSRSLPCIANNLYVKNPHKPHASPKPTQTFIEPCIRKHWLWKHLMFFLWIAWNLMLFVNRMWLWLV